jgi:hypothetical protein
LPSVAGRKKPAAVHTRALLHIAAPMTRGGMKTTIWTLDVLRPNEKQSNGWN